MAIAHTSLLRLLALVVISCASTGGCGDPQASGAACDLAAQTGCRSGQKCTHVCGADGDVVICVADGTLAVGTACPDGDMCVAGSFCASSARDPIASCREICSTNADCASGSCTQGPLTFCGNTGMLGFCD